MPGFESKVEGLSDLQAKLDQLKGPTAKRIMNRGLRAGAEVYRQEIVDRTPERVDDPSGTALPPGALKRDIRIATVSANDDLSSLVIVGPGKHTSHVMRWLEYGHRMITGGASKVLASGKKRGSGTEVGFVPAYPIMRPAFEGRRSEALAAVQESLTEDLSKGGQ